MPDKINAFNSQSQVLDKTFLAVSPRSTFSEEPRLGKIHVSPETQRAANRRFRFSLAKKGYDIGKTDNEIEKT